RQSAAARGKDLQPARRLLAPRRSGADLFKAALQLDQAGPAIIDLSKLIGQPATQADKDRRDALQDETLETPPGISRQQFHDPGEQDFGMAIGLRRGVHIGELMYDLLMRLFCAIAELLRQTFVMRERFLAEARE